MSTIGYGYGYGSEWQLLRFLGYHRDHLNDAIRSKVPNSEVLDWLDGRFETTPAAVDKDPPRYLDLEFGGLVWPCGTRARKCLPHP
jgi:hypothetical protein